MEFHLNWREMYEKMDTNISHMIVTLNKGPVIQTDTKI